MEKEIPVGGFETVVPCPDCAGTGYVLKKHHVAEAESTLVMFDPCNRCKATGVVDLVAESRSKLKHAVIKSILSSIYFCVLFAVLVATFSLTHELPEARTATSMIVSAIGIGILIIWIAPEIFGTFPEESERLKFFSQATTVKKDEDLHDVDSSGSDDLYFDIEPDMLTHQ